MCIQFLRFSPVELTRLRLRHPQVNPPTTLRLVPQHGHDDDTRRPEHHDAPRRQRRVLQHRWPLVRRVVRGREEDPDGIERDGEEVADEEEWGGSDSASAHVESAPGQEAKRWRKGRTPTAERRGPTRRNRRGQGT